MKLFVIVLCLLCERFLVHASAHHRFHWFHAYATTIEQRSSLLNFVSSPWKLLALIILPLLAISGLIFYVLGGIVFGLMGVLLNIFIFYYCLGPSNPFYPVREAATEELTSTEIETYLTNVNGQLFAVLFWYVLLGPISLLAYRLVSLCRNHPAISAQAEQLTGILDWVPIRMTALLYMLAGNFQAGLHYFSEFAFASPEHNQRLLGTCGMRSLAREEDQPLSMLTAESLVGRSVVVLLVLVACITLLKH